MVSPEAVVGSRAVNERENGEEECRCLFANSIFVDIFYFPLDYRCLSGNDDT